MPLPQPLPDLTSLELLVSVSEGRSISEAAAVHGMSQPAASMRLRNLERVLGLRLIERSRRGSALTTAGTAAVEWARRALDAVAALQAGAAALRNDERTHLRIAASLTVAEYLIPGWLQLLAASRPEVGVSLQMGNTSHVADLVATADVELGFVEGHRRVPGLRSRDVVPDELVVVVGARHPWTRRRKPVTAAELAATPLVLREPGSGTREVLLDALEALGYSPTVAVELGSTTAIKAAVAGGAGPSVLSALAVDTEVTAGTLAVVACPELSLPRTIRAVWSDRRPLGAAASTLLQLASATR